MPGIDKRMARYPQLFSRVGFAHHYRPLQDQELTFVLTRRDLGLSLDDADFTDTQAVAAIVRMTGGNFRLLHRLFVQIERILRLNELTVITGGCGRGGSQHARDRCHLALTEPCYSALTSTINDSPLRTTSPMTCQHQRPRRILHGGDPAATQPTQAAG